MRTMKKLLSICLIVWVGTAMAQEEEASTKPVFDSTPQAAVDISLAATGESNALALSINRMHPIAFKKRFSVGYGARFTGYFGQNNGYVTAPASVSEGNLLTPQNPDKLDTLWLKNSSVGSLNAAIYLEFKITPKLSAQFNIDAVGFSFGADRFGRFEAESQAASSPSEGASVTPFNLLLTGDYDIGSLNSELSVTYMLTDNLVLRPGVSFMFTEYTTHNPLAFGNDRFRKKSLMPMLALSYRL